MAERKKRQQGSPWLANVGVALAAVVAMISPLLVRVAAAAWGRAVLWSLAAALCAAAIALVLGWSIARIRRHTLVRVLSLIALAALTAALLAGLSHGTTLLAQVTRFCGYLILSFLFFLALRKTEPALGAPVLSVIWCAGVGVGEALVRVATPWADYTMEDLAVVGCASVVGALLWGAVLAGGPVTFELPTRSRIRLLYGLAGLMFLLTLLVSVSLLGHTIRDQEIGEFRSHYTLRKLERRRGDYRPPSTAESILKSTFTRVEDRFETEGLYHIRERDRYLAEGRPLKAYKENLIIEKYYAPVAAARGARLEGPALEELEASVDEDGGAYYHLSGPPEIVTWFPKPAAWIITVILAVFMVLWAEFIRVKSGS